MVASRKYILDVLSCYYRPGTNFSKLRQGEVLRTAKTSSRLVPRGDCVEASWKRGKRRGGPGMLAPRGLTVSMPKSAHQHCWQPATLSRSFSDIGLWSYLHVRGTRTSENAIESKF